MKSPIHQSLEKPKELSQDGPLAKSARWQDKFPLWFWGFALFTVFISCIPYLYGAWNTKEGEMYLGLHMNLDDQMVYAAWTKQASEGRFFFENLFTTDPQLGKNVNFYFFTMGQLARWVWIPTAMHIGRIVFTILFLLQLLSFAKRVTGSPFAQKVLVVFAVFGAGLGWLFWKRYGQESPIDVWQPEAFTFPSLMTNTLFPVSLWLMFVVWNSILGARDSWRPVLPGALAAFFLTNIHTYDTLNIAIVGLGLLLCTISGKTFSKDWLIRASMIALAAVPPVLWFVYMRANDSVFAARAATPTFSPPIPLVVLGLGLLIPLAWLGMVFCTKRASLLSSSNLFLSLFLYLVLLSALHFAQKAWGAELDVRWTLAWVLFTFAFAIYGASFRITNPAQALLVTWSLIGIALLYYPGLFQRKLAMGLSIPFSMLAGLFVSQGLEQIRRFDYRRLFTLLILLLIGFTNLRWIHREIEMAQDNISITTLHPVYLDPELTKIIETLEKNRKKNDVLLSIPGFSRRTDEDEWELLLPDLNAIATGLTGIKTYAGHWSETSNYLEKRAELVNMLYAQGATRESANEILRRTGATYVIFPLGEKAEVISSPIPEDVLGAEWKLVEGGASYGLYHLAR